MKFTPGPYYAANTGNIHDQGLVIVEDTGKTIAVVYDNQNSDILAAAPDMYEALKAIVARIDGDFDNPELMKRGPLSFYGMNDIVRFANEALAKAEGK